MPNVGRKGIVRFEDTIASYSIGTSLAGTHITQPTTAAVTGLVWLASMDTSDTPFAKSVSATKGLHYAGSLTGTDNNMLEICSPQLQFYGQQGFNAVDVLLQVDTCSSCEIAFGFNGDVIGSNTTIPVELATATWASTGTTFMGLVKDFDATNDEFHCFWTDDAVDTTESLANLRMRGASIAADKWLYMRVEMQDRGSGSAGVRATFHVEQDGKTFEKEFNTSVDRDAGMAWYLAVKNKAAIARGVYVRLPSWEQSIAD